MSTMRTSGVTLMELVVVMMIGSKGSMKMRKLQTGFTLIELVVVIVILGILAATALPKFVDLTTDANKAAVSGFAGAIDSGNGINYGAYLARRTVSDGSVATVAPMVDTSGGCSLTTANALLQVPLPTTPAYTVTTAAAALAMSANTTCTLRAGAAGSPTATFTLTGAK